MNEAVLSGNVCQLLYFRGYLFFVVYSFGTFKFFVESTVCTPVRPLLPGATVQTHTQSRQSLLSKERNNFFYSQAIS